MIVRHVSSQDSSYTFSVRYYSAASCNWGSWAYTSLSYENEADSALGEDIPHYYLKKKRGSLLPFTNYTWFHCEEDPCLWDIDCDVLSRSSCNGVLSHYEMRNKRYVPLDTSTAELTGRPSEMTEGSRFVQMAVAKIYGQGFDALTFVVELKSLLRMLVGILKRWADLLARARFEDLWLEGRYGWRPLIYDVRDFENAVRNLSSEVKRYKERVGTTYSTVTTDVKTDVWSTGDHITYTTNNNVERSVRGSVVMDIAVPRFRTDLSVTAWEVIPFSFVIDWFFDISSWLLSMHGLSISKGHVASVSVKTTKTSQYTRIDQTKDVSYTRTFTPTTGQIVSYTLLRRVPTGITLSPPTFNINVDILKIVDLIALLRQRVRR